MSTNILSQTALTSGRRDITQSLPTTTPTFTPTPYVRPSDWTALPTVAGTSYVTGIYAVYNQESNFVALGCSVSGGSIAVQGAIAGTIFSRLESIATYSAGQLVTGTGVATNTIINSLKTSVITGSIASTGSVLTVTSHSGDPLVVGSVFLANSATRFITGFVSGSGTTGTYTYSGTPSNGTVTAVTSNYATVTISQTVGNFTTPTTVALTNVSQYQVDWGDGSPIEISPGNQVQHNYVYSSVPGVVSSRGYKTAAITITPYNPFGATFNLISANFNARYSPGVGQGFINAYVSRWLDMRINIFGANGFQVEGNLAPLNMLEQVQVDTTGGVAVNFSNKFINLRSFQNLILDPSIVVTNYVNCFNNTALISGPSLSSTNTSSATQTAGMFQNCVNLTYCPDYNFASNLNAASMFSGCQALVQSPALYNPGVTTSALTDVQGIFNACVQLVRVTSFPTNNVSGGGFNNMFSGCFSLRTENLPLFNTAGATQLQGMFASCTSLTTIPLYNTINVTNFTQMFFGCSALIQVPLLNTSNATVMTQMFQNCTALQTIPQFNTAKVTDMGTMFSGTTSLITIPLLDTSNVLSFASTFLNSGIQNIPLLNTSKVTNMDTAFRNTSKLVTIPTFDTSNVTNMSSMFNQSNVQSIPLLNTINVNNMSSMFQSSRVQTVANLNTGNVTLMTSMFLSCSTLATAPTFTDTSKVTAVNNMFNGCTRLSSIPTYNLANVTNFVAMCNGANNLVSFSAINVGSQAIANFSSMFFNTSSLVNVSNINLSNATSPNILNFSSTPSLTSLSNVTNARFNFSVASSDFGRQDLQNVFQNVLTFNTTAQTITIGFNPGADTANAKTSGITAGSNVITMANTVGVTAGTYLYGIGVNTSIAVTLDVGTSTVVYTNGGGVNGLANGDNVMFTSLSLLPPAGIVINTPYFVVNRTSTTFQVSATAGGVALAVNTGSGLMSIGGASISNQVLTVNANANVIINGVSGATNASAALTNRALNQNYATTKNWVVSG